MAGQADGGLKMHQSAGGGVEGFSGGVIKGSFVVAGAQKAQAGFTVYKLRFKVSQNYFIHLSSLRDLRCSRCSAANLKFGSSRAMQISVPYFDSPGSFSFLADFHYTHTAIALLLAVYQR